MILFVTILSLALLGTLGCFGTLVYVNMKEREANRAVTNVHELTKVYLTTFARALEENAVNSSDTYVQSHGPERIAELTPAQRYRPVVASAR
jgi:hypothetical protein